KGMTVAGRAISVTHDADMWTRGQYCCLVTGQIAGTAAALAAMSDVSPDELETAALQHALEQSGVDIGSASEASRQATAYYSNRSGSRAWIWALPVGLLVRQQPNTAIGLFHNAIRPNTHKAGRRRK